MEDTNGADDHSAIHMSLQGKGGVGKSLAASVLAQYFMARGKAVRCIDADPVNKTLLRASTSGPGVTQYRLSGSNWNRSVSTSASSKARTARRLDCRWR